MTLVALSLSLIFTIFKIYLTACHGRLYNAFKLVIIKSDHNRAERPLD